MTSINPDSIYITKNFEHKFSVHLSSEVKVSREICSVLVMHTTIKTINVMAHDFNNTKRTISNFQFPVSNLYINRKRGELAIKNVQQCGITRYDKKRASKIALANSDL